MVEVLSSYCADQSFDEGMRQRDIRYSLDLRNLDNPEIGFPLVESEQRVMVRAQISWAPGSTDDAVEHAADCGPIEYFCIDGEANDSSGKLIHNHHYPMGFEDQRFTSKKIHTPQTVFAVAQESEPGRTVGSRLRPVVFGEYAPYQILINLSIAKTREICSAMRW